ncbi:hypothetical protein DPEC_G00324750 [Dallia pectoralis]|uniref:Uncharacterized protein n=1 Tax=Dallia pectoralis TaxID=75939 RepID=A0ACC2FB07_DALPE|nr:hypothetical protein DPEC_G00324750 [Dallia pectoralis]
MSKKRSKAGEGQRKTRRRVSFLSSIPPDLLEGTAPTTSDEHSSGPGLTPEPTSTVGSHSGWTRFLSRWDCHHKYSPEVIPVVPQPFQDHSSPRPQSPDSDAQGQILPGSQSDTGTECRDLVNLEALGLPNIGNSCFLNATLQCLLVLPVFLQEIHRQRIENLSWLSSCYNLHRGGLRESTQGQRSVRRRWWGQSLPKGQEESRRGKKPFSSFSAAPHLLLIAFLL